MLKIQFGGNKDLQGIEKIECNFKFIFRNKKQLNIHQFNLSKTILKI